MAAALRDVRLSTPVRGIRIGAQGSTVTTHAGEVHMRSMMIPPMRGDFSMSSASHGRIATHAAPRTPRRM